MKVSYAPMPDNHPLSFGPSGPPKAQEDRSRIIGGSDISAVMGLNRWKTPLALWAEKTGKIKDDPLANFEAKEIGSELEEYVSRKFQRKTGIKLRVDQRTFRHLAYPYMVAHIDRWVVGKDACFEAKTCSAWKMKEWEGDSIPQEYVLQLMWYLGILGKQTGYIAVLIGGQHFTWKEIQFDQDLFDKQVAAAQVFMEQFVLKDIPPMALADDQDTLALLFPTSKPDTITFDEEAAKGIDYLVSERTAALAFIKDQEKRVDELEVKLKQHLGESAFGETDTYQLSWKTVEKRAYTVPAKSFRQFRCSKKKGV